MTAVVDSRRVRATYDALGRDYDPMTAMLDRLFLDRLRDGLVTRARGNVLEVAIGTGKNLRFYPRECRVTGVDFSQAMLDEATNRAGAMGRAFDARRADVNALPFADASFDTVTCTLAMCTFTEPHVAMREMRRVCRPGGQVLLLEHVRPRDRVVARMFDAITPFTQSRLGCTPNRDVRAIAEEAGLRIESAHTPGRGIVLSAVAVR
jgi:ubiquinone/menaquinone biosynthesis C-methylase UbiE